MEIMLAWFGQAFGLYLMQDDYTTLEDLVRTQYANAVSYTHLENFSRLPDNQGDIKLFADLFNNISNNYYRSIPQLFTWTKRTYRCV